MSEQDTGTDTDTDLGPQPEARIEPGEPNPGGVDAVAESDGIEAQDDEVVARDLDPDNNPAVEEALPEEMKQREDTATSATDDDQGEVDEETESEESPA